MSVKCSLLIVGQDSMGNTPDKPVNFDNETTYAGVRLNNTNRPFNRIVKPPGVAFFPLATHNEARADATKRVGLSRHRHQEEERSSHDTGTCQLLLSSPECVPLPILAVQPRVSVP